MMLVDFSQRSALELSIDVAMMSYMAAFSVVTLSYCAAMWQLRKEFFIALRYRVACVSLV